MAEELTQKIGMLGGLFVVFIILIAVLPRLISSQLEGSRSASASTLKRAWKKAADRIGFRLTVGPGIKGARRGRSVDASVRTDAAVILDNQKQEKYTRFRVELRRNRWKEGVKIRPRSFFAKLEKSAVGEIANLEGEPVVRTGDDKFDRDFMVGGKVTESTKRALRSASVQQALRDLVDRFGWYEIKIGELVVDVDKGIANPDQLVRHIDRCIDAADLLDDAMVADVDVSARDQVLFPPPLP